MPRSLLAVIPTMTLAFPGLACADLQFNLQPPVTPVAREIYDLHTLILLVCLLIFLVVSGFMSYALIMHRKAKGHRAAIFHQNMKLEILWTLIPFLILVGMAYPTTKTVLEMKNVEQSDLSIKVTGHQWQWEYEHMGEGVRYSSSLSTPRAQIDNQATKGPHYLLEVNQPLVVPTGKKVRLILTSTDVIHSWWVPQFGVKQDAIPGFIHETWIKVEKTGIYRGQCAELCGVGHGFMPVVVEAVTPDRYAAWLAEQKAAQTRTAALSGKTYTLAELKAHGEVVFTASCAMCHQANGLGVAGAFPPLIDGSPFSAGATLTAPLAARGFWKDGKIILGSKDRHLDIVMNGITGTAMQALGRQLSDFDVAAVVSYERNNWGNHTGDAIQPAEVAALRKGAPS